MTCSAGHCILRVAPELKKCHLVLSAKDQNRSKSGMNLIDHHHQSPYSIHRGPEVLSTRALTNIMMFSMFRDSARSTSRLVKF